jgi:hypothetical protein
MCTELQWDFTAVARLFTRCGESPSRGQGCRRSREGFRFEPRYLGCYEHVIEFYHLFTGVLFLSEIMWNYVNRAEMELYRA